jgi:hypothetical protein
LTSFLDINIYLIYVIAIAMTSPEVKMTSPEALFRYSELRGFIQQHTGKRPSPSTLNAWMEAVLDVPPYDPANPRQYTLDEAMALVLWGQAGELAKRGQRKTSHRWDNLPICSLTTTIFLLL